MLKKLGNPPQNVNEQFRFRSYSNLPRLLIQYIYTYILYIFIQYIHVDIRLIQLLIIDIDTFLVSFYRRKNLLSDLDVIEVIIAKVAKATRAAWDVRKPRRTSVPGEGC